MTGKDKMAAKAAELKGQTQEKDEAERKSALSALEKTRQIISSNPEMMARMQEDANEEQKDRRELPLLKVYIANKSHFTLLDGSEPHNGWFIHTITQQEYPEVYCHILKISRGFRMLGLPDEKTGVAKKQWTHIVAGVMLNDAPVPFWMLVSGQNRVQRLWAFQDELRKYNKAGIPSFPLTIKLTTEKVEISKTRQAVVINFAVEMDDEGKPDMVLLPSDYLALREQVHEQEEYIRRFIEKNEVEKDQEPEPIMGEEEATAVLPSAEKPASDQVNPDEIPF